MNHGDPSSNVYALVAAAGSGRRMGGGASKCLAQIGGVPAIARVVAALASSEIIREIVVMVREEEEASFRAAISIPGVHFTPGGETRSASVRCGLRYLRASFGCEDSDFVLVHDGARCLLSSDLVRRSVEGARLHLAVTAAIPSVDSIKLVEADGRVAQSLPRERLMAIQTPQVFRADLLRRAHEEGNPDATDDAALVERFHPVFIVPGDSKNLKVTGPGDIVIAEALLQAEKEISSPS